MEDLISFEIIHTWISSDDFLNPTTDKPYFYSYIVQAFLLAERLQMPEVCDAMLAHLRRTAPAGLPYYHGFIYSNTTRGSSFRKTLVDMLIKDSRFGDFCDFPPDYGANSEPFQIVPCFPIVHHWNTSDDDDCNRPRVFAGFEERAGEEAQE